jgi:hypothetical protein
MPHVTLTLILGKPSHRQIKQLEGELTVNLIVVPCPWGHNKGHLGLLDFSKIWPYISSAMVEHS